MKRLLLTSLVLAPSMLVPLAAAGGKGEDPKEALQALQEYIGGWKGTGALEKKNSNTWDETAQWSWRFKGKDVYLTVDMKKSKLYKSGEMRYLPDNGKYQLTLVDQKNVKSVFEGELKKNGLVLQRKNPAGDTEELRMRIVGGGDRLVQELWTKPQGRTLFSKQYQVGYTKEGVTFGTLGGEKKPECVVTGGLGTMAVSYMGQTYYVCCSGCRDAFNENPAKIIAEYNAKKKAGR
jgi:hypothetical protein